MVFSMPTSSWLWPWAGIDHLCTTVSSSSKHVEDGTHSNVL